MGAPGRRWMLWTALVLALCPAPRHVLAAEDEFYKGKTVTLVVGYSVGGGYDQYARALARHLGSRIPGNPSVLVMRAIADALEIPLFELLPQTGGLAAPYARIIDLLGRASPSDLSIIADTIGASSLWSWISLTNERSILSRSIGKLRSRPNME